MARQRQQLEDWLIAEQASFYRLAYSYLHDRDDSLDAVQTAVCQALERKGSLRNPEAIRSWFYRILVNVCIDILRQKNRLVASDPETLDVGQYEDPLPKDDTLARQVDALPTAMQTVVKLRFYEDMTLKEISAVTGWNLNTVKTRLYTGLKKLRIELEEQQYVQ